MPSADLVPSISITALISRRNDAAARIQAAHRAIREANEIMDATFEGGDTWGLHKIHLECRSTHSRFHEDDGADALIRAMDAKHWDWLLEKSGLRTFMDAEARRKWDESISKRDVPSLTHENIEATFAQLYSARGEMFERGVIRLFRRLSWNYKTNQPIRLGKRMVLTRIVDTWGARQPFAWSRLRCDAGNELDDLMRVLCVLDGKPEPDHRSGAAARLRASGWPGQGQNPMEIDGYFSIRGFRNGNAHLTFLRPDLVDEMNRIIAKHHPGALPPAREAA